MTAGFIEVSVCTHAAGPVRWRDNPMEPLLMIAAVCNSANYAEVGDSWSLYCGLDAPQKLVYDSIHGVCTGDGLDAPKELFYDSLHGVFTVACTKRAAL